MSEMQKGPFVGGRADFEAASDLALVVSIGRWHQAALQEAYCRHGGVVLALARKVLGDRMLAEDMVQEVFVRLWYEPHKFDPERGSLRSYLLAQCHGRSVDLLRSETARRNREERQARLASPARYELQSEVEVALEAEDVRDALKILPKTEREAIKLAYFGGYTYQQVAGILNVAEGTIKSRIRAGLRRMRNTLVEAGAFEARVPL